MSAQLRGPGIYPETQPVTTNADLGFSAWQGTNVRPQKQAGYVMVAVRVPLGDLTSEQMRVLGDLALAYSDGTACVTADQGFVFRWIKTDRVKDLYRSLCAASLGLAGANTIADVGSCPGAESCKLAVTQSRGLGKTLDEFLRASPELVALAPDVDIKISGCPKIGRAHV